jgi:hypothetical protein
METASEFFVSDCRKGENRYSPHTNRGKRKVRRILWAIVLSGAASNSVAQESFPCAKLTRGEYRIFKGLSPLNDAPIVPIKIKKGAIVLQQKRALLTDWKKPEGLIGAVVPYQQPQLLFRPYRIEGALRYCAQSRRDDVFGAGDKSQQYLLRCLIDSNADGQYEGFRRYVELVRIDGRTGKTDAPSGVSQADQPLVKPFALLPADVRLPQNNGFDLAVQSIIKIKEVRKNVASISIRTFVSFGLDEIASSFGPSPDGKVAELSLQDGLETMIEGTSLVIKRRGNDWMITANRGFSGKADLICGGSALDTGAEFTIFTSGGMFVVNQQQADAIN